MNFFHMRRRLKSRIAPMGRHQQVHDNWEKPGKRRDGMYSGSDYPYKSSIEENLD